MDTVNRRRPTAVPAQAADASSVLEIRFAERKYGRELLVDAAAVHHLPGFITDDRAHRLFFYDVTFVTGGRGVLRIDGEDHPVARHRVITTTPGQIRAWSLNEPLRGFAVFFKAEFFLEFLSGPRFLQSILGFRPGSPQSFALPQGSFAGLVRQVQQVKREILAGDPDTDALVHATVYRLLLDLRRHLRDTLDGRSTPAARRRHPMVDKYLTLLDLKPRANRTVRDSAAWLGVTPGYLNRLTRRDLGLGAQQVAHDQLMLEAKRLLRFTDLTVRQVSRRLGFSDAAYFSKFFRVQSGESPRSFRAARAPS